jgi:hypothetical protein
VKHPNREQQNGGKSKRNSFHAGISSLALVRTSLPLFRSMARAKLQSGREKSREKERFRAALSLGVFRAPSNGLESELPEKSHFEQFKLMRLWHVKLPKCMVRRPTARGKF